MPLRPVAAPEGSVALRDFCQAAMGGKGTRQLWETLRQTSNFNTVQGDAHTRTHATDSSWLTSASLSLAPHPKRPLLLKVNLYLVQIEHALAPASKFSIIVHHMQLGKCAGGNPGFVLTTFDLSSITLHLS